MAIESKPSPSAAAGNRRRPAALMVAAGIFLSKIAGLVRERVFAHYLGNSAAAGAFRAALRIPNLLQNLFGEGVLSASFIPSYARLLAGDRQSEASQVASVVMTLLVLTVSVLVAVGVGFSRELIDILAPGFSGEIRELTIRLVALMFPGMGMLVLSAWCLGILNSHRRFFLSYFAPVLWNFAIIGYLLYYGHRLRGQPDMQMRLAVDVAWGTVVGAALQLLVQLPQALRLNHGLRLALDLRLEPVRAILANFFPALLARGVVQLSAYIDQVLASFLGPQAVAAMAYSQTLYLLPVSLFGMSISTTELTEMSRTTGTADEIGRAVVGRLAAGLGRLAFFIVPSAVAFVILGETVTATLFQTGHFGSHDVRFVWLILIGGSVGLLATTQSRLCVSAFWALGDTRTPAGFALVRVLLTGGLGYLATFPLREHYQWHPALAAAVLTGSAGVSGWLEFLFIRRWLRQRIGRFDPPGRILASAWIAALLAAAIGLGVRHLLTPLGLPPWLAGSAILGAYGAVYLAIQIRWGAPESRAMAREISRRWRR
jgi:putative peptidoglycan lipid II flippase